MIKLDNQKKNLKAGSMLAYGGWGFATLANVLVNGAVGLTTNSLNIANSAKKANEENNYIYKQALTTKYNFF